jgi:hypothetical protein
MSAMSGVPVACVVLPILSQPFDLDQDVRKRISLSKVANLVARLVPLADRCSNDEDEKRRTCRDRDTAEEGADSDQDPRAGTVMLR